MTHPAYFVFDARIHDPEGMKPYLAKVEGTYKAFGGRRIVAGGALETHEGDAPIGRIVILQFPSMAEARAWHDSPAYQAIVGYRLASAESRAYLVEGLALP